MAMMMPPEASRRGCRCPRAVAPGMPEIPPMDAMSSTPLPAEGGIEGLMAALGEAGRAPGGLEGLGLPGGAAPGEEMGAEEEMDAVEHIQQAMKHLMMAMAGERGRRARRRDREGHGCAPGSSSAASRSARRSSRTRVASSARLRGSTAAERTKDPYGSPDRPGSGRADPRPSAPSSRSRGTTRLGREGRAALPRLPGDGRASARRTSLAGAPS